MSIETPKLSLPLWPAGLSDELKRRQFNDAMAILDDVILSNDPATLALALKGILTTAGDFLYNDSGNVVRKSSSAAAAIIASNLADDAISGNKLNGGTYSNFASTGITDAATATALNIASSNRVAINATPDTTTFKVLGLGTANIVLFSQSSNGAGSMYCPDGLTMAAGESSANAPLKVRKDSTTGRSINSAGTNNASGADYAEYYIRRSDCGVCAKGQCVGFDAAGLITDKWALAISFGVKSTFPSYVGGDFWGSEESLGLSLPEPPLPPADPIDDGRISYHDLLAAIEAYPAASAAYEAAATKYVSDKAAFDAALETARQTVDRIAVAGKVPAIVSGDVTDGGWIVPMQDGEGIKIVCIPDSDVTFDQYRKRVGRVLIANPDATTIRRLIPAEIPDAGWSAIIDVVKG